MLIFLLALTLLFFLPALLRNRQPLRIGFLHFLLILWILYALCRGYFDPSPSFALEKSLHKISWALLALLIVGLCRDLRDFSRLVWVAVLVQLGPIAMATANIFGVDIYFHWILQKDWYWGSELIGRDRGIIWSSLGNPNFYANYGAMVILWLTALLLIAKRLWVKLFYGSVIVVLLVTLVFTQTRGIWVALIPTVFLILFGLGMSYLLKTGDFQELWRSYGKTAMMICLSGLLLFTAVYWIEFKRGGGPVHAIVKRFELAFSMRDASTRYRPLMWSASIRMWSEQPWFGQGAGRFAPRYLGEIYEISEESGSNMVQQITRQINTEYSDQSHNDYLQVLAEYGGIGFGLFLFILLTTMAKAIQFIHRHKGTREEKLLLLGAASVCIFTAISSLYDFPFLLPASTIFFALGLGGVLVFERVEGECLFSLPRLLCWPLVVVLLGTALWIGSIAISHTWASHLRNYTLKTLNNSDQTTDAMSKYSQIRLAEEYITTARKHNPDDGRILFLQGKVYTLLSNYDMRYLSRGIRLMENAKETYYSPEVYHVLARAYLRELNSPRARQEAEILHVINPMREGINHLLGLVYFVSGRAEQAESFFQREVSVNEKNAEAFQYLGKIYEQRQEYEAAAEMYRKSFEINRGSLEINERLAVLYAGPLNDPIKSINHYRYALQIANVLGDRAKESGLNIKLREVQNRLDPNVWNE